MSKQHITPPLGTDLREGVTAHTSDGTITQRPLEGGPFDTFHVTAEQREEYGVRDNETLRWVRDPDTWRAVEKLDRVEQMKATPARGGMSARLITTSEFDKVYIGGGTNGDLILMAVPNEIVESQQNEVDEAQKVFEYGMRPTPEGYVTEEEFMERDPAEIKRRMRQEHDYNTRTGLIGPTAGMSLPEADAFLRRKGVDVEAKQEALRSGGYHAPISKDDFAAVMSGSKALAKKPGKTVGMGDSGFKRNPNSALSQVQRRGAQGGTR